MAYNNRANIQYAEVEINTKDFDQKLAEYLDENSEQIAKNIAQEAKATTAFIDRTGELRKSIKVKKSKFEDGGYIVRAGGRKAKQAWLIEHGRSPGDNYPGAPAKPFLKPALDNNINEAKRLFGAK